MKIDVIKTDKNDFTFSNLDHFSTYEITVKACRELIGDEDVFQACGPEVQKVARTLESDSADDIDKFDVMLMPSNTSTHDIKLIWEQPANPNGFILNYDVKQIKIDDKSLQTELICISLMQRSNVTYQIIGGLKPGNYSIQMAAVTLAGQGNYTSPKFLYVPPISHFSIIFSPALLVLIFLILLSFGAALVYTIYKRNHPENNINRLVNFHSEDAFDH